MMGDLSDTPLNYLAHGRLYLDRPWFVAGTALPDWLAASDRPARIRREAVARGSDLGAGVHRHFEDDRWFHSTEAFQRCEAELTALVREANRDEPRQRSWFFGHVLTELLLDAWLMREEPGLLDDYYRALSAVDAGQLVDEAAPWLTQQPERLGGFIALFLDHRFLEGYATDAGLLARLNGIARRVRLPSLSLDTLSLLPEARSIVYDRAPELLTP